jgi:hypothetical protein
LRQVERLLHHHLLLLLHGSLLLLLLLLLLHGHPHDQLRGPLGVLLELHEVRLLLGQHVLHDKVPLRCHRRGVPHAPDERV